MCAVTMCAVTRVVGHYALKRWSSSPTRLRLGPPPAGRCGALAAPQRPSTAPHRPGRTAQSRDIGSRSPSGSAARCVVPVSSLCRSPCVIVPYSLWTSSSTFQVHNLDSDFFHGSGAALTQVCRVPHTCTVTRRVATELGSRLPGLPLHAQRTCQQSSSQQQPPRCASHGHLYSCARASARPCAHCRRLATMSVATSRPRVGHVATPVYMLIRHHR